MKKIHTYESFLNEQERLNAAGFGTDATLNRATEHELRLFNREVKAYIAMRREDADVCERALELLDEIYKASITDVDVKEKLYYWLLNGKTLALQELMKNTTYKGNGNSPEQLRDFNAFSLLDTVRSHRNK